MDVFFSDFFGDFWLAVEFIHSVRQAKTEEIVDVIA